MECFAEPNAMAEPEAFYAAAFAAANPFEFEQFKKQSRGFIGHLLKKGGGGGGSSSGTNGRVIMRSRNKATKRSSSSSSSKGKCKKCVCKCRVRISNVIYGNKYLFQSYGHMTL